MDEEELVKNFIQHWKKSNKDKYFDTYDVKYSLRQFCIKNYGFTPDFRSKKHQEIWQKVKVQIFNE